MAGPEGGEGRNDRLRLSGPEKQILQAMVLADRLASGDLAAYQRAHRRLARRPMIMSKLMLELGRRNRLRRSTLRAMAAQPRIFQSMLSWHVYAPSFS